MRRGVRYLVAIMHWFTRKVLAWRVSNTLEADFCVEAMSEAIHRFGPPEILNTDQGSQFTPSPGPIGRRGSEPGSQAKASHLEERRGSSPPLSHDVV